MQANNEKKNLEYCRYYHGEQQDPYRDSFKGRAWIAEQLACERASESAKDFLSFVAAHISKWEPYGYEPDVARYIAFYEHCSFEEKLEIAKIYAIGEALQFKKPRGRTIFESHSDDSFITPYTIDVGVLLYNDGRVYIKNTLPEGRLRRNLFQNEQKPCYQLYFYVGKFKETADAVKKLIEENWTAISVLPKKSDCLEVCDGSYSYYKFLTKRCGGYEYEESEDGKAVKPFHDRILNIFYRMNTPSYEWFETTTDVEPFVEVWSLLLDEIDADETRTKVYDFTDDRFAEDCRNLGFEMDVFESFFKHCDYDPQKGPEKKFEELVEICSDYHVLGNAIFSQWRYYNHWAYDVKAEFDTNWFRLAFKKLLELAC